MYVALLSASIEEVVIGKEKHAVGSLRGVSIRNSFSFGDLVED